MPPPAWWDGNVGNYRNANGWTGRPRRVRHALIWPNDRNRGKWGRICDLATGKGPDIFLVSNPNRAPNAADGPGRPRWSGYPGVQDAYEREADRHSWMGPLPWARRTDKHYYDFQARRFRRREFDGMWTDAQYMPGGRHLTAFRTYPHDNQHIMMDPDQFRNWDPLNYGQNGVMYGVNGRGGYHFPPVDERQWID